MIGSGGSGPLCCILYSYSYTYTHYSWEWNVNSFFLCGLLNQIYFFRCQIHGSFFSSSYFLGLFFFFHSFILLLALHLDMEDKEADRFEIFCEWIYIRDSVWFLWSEPRCEWILNEIQFDRSNGHLPSETFFVLNIIVIHSVVFICTWVLFI